MNCLDWIFWLLKSNPKLENTIFALFRNKWLAHYNLPQTNFLSHEPYIATKQPLKSKDLLNTNRYFMSLFDKT